MFSQKEQSVRSKACRFAYAGGKKFKFTESSEERRKAPKKNSMKQTILIIQPYDGCQQPSLITHGVKLTSGRVHGHSTTCVDAQQHDR